MPPSPSASPTDPAFSLLEVASHLHVAPDTLRSWSRRFARFLMVDPESDTPRFSSGDVATLLTLQKLLEQGYSDEQVSERMLPRRIESSPVAAVSLSPQQSRELLQQNTAVAQQALGDMLSAIANSQQAVLNGQATVREMTSVVVQDNFNLKDENRKLRDRMLELERALAEYQRREETRKEKMESRLRALEGTVAALQQQIAQLVQLQRQSQKRRGWW